MTTKNCSVPKKPSNNSLRSRFGFFARSLPALRVAEAICGFFWIIEKGYQEICKQSIFGVNTADPTCLSRFAPPNNPVLDSAFPFLTVYPAASCPFDSQSLKSLTSDFWGIFQTSHSRLSQYGE